MTDTSKEAVDPRCAKCGNPRSNHSYRHPFVGPSLTDTIDALTAKLAEVTAERDRQKRRGDNHWETLRSIRDIAKRSGDIDRIIQWVNDAGQGYCETAETTLSKEMDRAEKAEAALATARRDALKKAAAFIVDNQTVMFTGQASDFVQTRTRSADELARMLSALIDTEEGEG